jgi:hypothetical protein
VVSAAVAVLAATLSGCVTVHGEAAVIPAVSKPEAKKVLKHFNSVSNKANRRNDAKLNNTIETGALGAIDQAGLISRKGVEHGNARNFTPLRLSDPRFLIPKQSGWPKFFVADTRSNSPAAQGKRCLFVFQRDSADSPWKAAYLSLIVPSQMPHFAFGSDGHVKAVPVGSGSRLTIGPSRLSSAYVRYLQDGGDEFAPGPQTSARREARKKSASQPAARTEYADQPAQPPQYAPYGLRTGDGGALVFFASYHQTRQTVAKGYHPQVRNPYVKALLSGKAKQSVTYVRMSQQAVKVPARKAGGPVTFLNRIDGLTSAKGE